MGLVIEALSDANAAEWDELVRGSPDGWSFSLAGWQRLILNVEEWGLEDHSFAIREGANLVAVMPLQYRREHKVMGSSGWGGSGPVIGADRSPTDREVLFTRCIETAKAAGGKVGAERLEMSCSPVTSASLANRWQVSPFLTRGLADASRLSQVIDLSPGREIVFAGLSQIARRWIRKAQQTFDVRRVDWLEHLERYYEIHAETYRRTGVSPHPKSYFSGIAAQIAPSENAVLFAAFDQEGKVVAYHNDARLGVGAYYHTGCSLESVQDTGVNYLLMWAAIEDASARDLKWYDVGWIFCSDASEKQKGLTAFKTKFGGEPHLSFISSLALPPQPVASKQAPATDEVRRAYEDGEIYKVETICNTVKQNATEYIDRLLEEKLNLVRRNMRPGLLVDLCCATGEHLFALADGSTGAIGMDFSRPFIEKAHASAVARGKNVRFEVADAKALPLDDNSVATLYSFSALYAIPGVSAVFAEIGRVLQPGGRCVLDLGNSRSLNSICVKAYTDLPPTYHMRPKEMRALAAASGLKVIEERAFQILPLWASKPHWMEPLLHPRWKRIMAKRIGGRMLDDWLSNFPLLKPFAFRRVLVCEKAR